MARGDQWMDWRAGHTPEGNPCLIGGLSRGGFALIEPAARRIRQIRPPVCLSTSWGFCQTPDGNIWQVDFGQHSEAALCVWEGKGDTSRVATRLPLRYLFALEAFSDGSLLLGNQKQPVLHRWEPSSGRLEEWSRLPGKTGAQVILRGRDGWIYILGSEGRDRVIYAANPGGQVSLLLRLELHNPVMWYEVLKRNREGTVFVQDPGKGRWWRLAGGNATGAGEEMPEGLVRVRQWPSVGFAAFGYTLPALMPDGTRVESITDRTFGCRSPEGAAFSFTADRSETPLRIFSVAAARGKIWGGTFIPLTLFSHDLRTGKTVNHGNPTQSSSGEIYSIAEQGGKLFFGSYANASITRYDPDAPWQPGFLAESNPRELGMVSESPDTHRPVASIAHPDGGVYFCAYDTYLPEKIGAIARVDPSSEQIARWALPDLEISSAAAGPAPGQLLLAHRGPGSGLAEPESGGFWGQTPAANPPAHPGRGRPHLTAGPQGRLPDSPARLPCAPDAGGSAYLRGHASTGRIGSWRFVPQQPGRIARRPHCRTDPFPCFYGGSPFGKSDADGGICEAARSGNRLPLRTMPAGRRPSLFCQRLPPHAAPDFRQGRALRFLNFLIPSPRLLRQ